MQENNRKKRVLAIDPCRKGIGFAVFEDKLELAAWGLALTYSPTTEAFLTRLTALVQRYKPDVLIVSTAEDRRSRRVQAWLERGRGDRIPSEKWGAAKWRKVE